MRSSSFLCLLQIETALKQEGIFPLNLSVTKRKTIINEKPSFLAVFIIDKIVSSSNDSFLSPTFLLTRT